MIKPFYNANYSLYWLLTLAAVLGATGVFAQPADNTGTFVYSAAPHKPLRIWFDYYHHSLPNTRVGNHLVTGSWIAGAGRYAWNDFVHSNTFDPVFTALGDEHQITIGRQPFTQEVLADQEAVLILNPDNPKVVPEVPAVSDKEIATLIDFVNRGGSLMIMINATTPDRSAEDFESIQLKKLVNAFGLAWNFDDTHYSDVPIGNAHPYFYDVPVFHYGAGCTLKILPGAVKPEVLMEVASDAGYPDRHVRGAGIVQVRPGKGKVILVGDIGSWTGNMSRPWAENERILKQLFRYLKPDREVHPARYNKDAAFNYKITVAGLQAIPVANSLSALPKPVYRLFHPREKTGMPYLEGTATVSLISNGLNGQKAAALEARIGKFSWFDSTVAAAGESVRFIASRQGKATDIKTNGTTAGWLAPDIASLIALLPVDGLQPGDRWESLETLRIPAFQGTDLPPVRQLELPVTYVQDEMVNGIRCRLLRTAEELWLKDLDIGVPDLLTSTAVDKKRLTAYRYYNERGGKLLFKREQWVNAATGVVMKARTQTRVLAWIADARKPVDKSNADKDNNMILSLAQTITAELQ
ncbi:hypothetical protein [Niabella beijingensis]|uniref:hypothetical protein n=1 Tax=Niabella beijingensis TaxID=2872700 RepID=UPI001CBE9C59|nr:hypothetical protein [Niabella beijingensis]MBZ4190887.1 hypothetical protein [Niabella beijingensis]